MTAVLRAGLVCARRRASWPLVAAVAVLPVLAWLAGRRAEPVLATAVEAGRAVALSVALGLGATAAVAGIVVALAAPRRTFVGPQLAAAPLSGAALFAAVTLAPLLLAGAAASLVEAAFLIPAVGAAAPAALAAGWAGFALGAAAGEGALGAWRIRVGALGAVAGLWAAGAWGAGTGLLAGPFGYLGLALRGEPARAGQPSAMLAVVALTALAVWSAAAAHRSDDLQGRDHRPRLPIGRRPYRAVFSIGLKRYARRRELRRTARAAAAATAVGGLLLAHRGGAGVVPFVGVLAVLGAVVIPLAAVGVDREAEWLWRAVPIRRAATAAAGLAAALAAALAVVLVGVGPAAAWARAPGGALLQVLGVAVFVFAAAVIAGALVPWRSDRPAEELGSLATLAGVAAVLWYGLGHAVEELGGGLGASTAVLAGTLLLALGLASLLAARGDAS